MGHDLKRDISSMVAELKQTAEEGHEDLDRTLAKNLAQLEAASAFWKDPPEISASNLRKADHVVSLEFKVPHKMPRVQIALSLAGMGDFSDLYVLEAGHYDALVILKRRDQ